MKTKHALIAVVALTIATTGIVICFRTAAQRATVAGVRTQDHVERESGNAAVRSGPTATQAAPSKPLRLAYASPAPNIAPAISSPPPVPVQATIQGKSSTYSPKFNVGRSERMAVSANQIVPVTLSWPEDKEHSGVFIQAVHGGKIDGRGNSKTVMFGPDRTASFTFTPDAGAGTYEIVLRRGTTEEALSFWVPTGNPTDPPTVKIN
jgi:hypothetical protein